MDCKNGIITKIYPTDCAYDKVIVDDRTMVIGSSAAIGLEMKEVVLPECVTEIQDYAFHDCEKLETINMPAGLKKIGERSFSGCKSLKKIVIPEGVTSIGASTFSGCESLEEIVFPSTLKEIKYRTLADCKNLKRVVIPDSIKKMGWGVFSGCEKLEKVTIPDSVDTFEYQMFLNCSSLKEVSLPSTLTSLPDETFMGCNSLENFVLPKAITKVGNGAFSGCKSLRFFPEQVVSFGESSFKNCRNLTSAKINKDVKALPNDMFNGCIKLKNVTYESILPIGERAFKSCISLEEIPSFVRSYNKFAFENCIGIKELTLVSDNIPEGTFKGCKNLKRISGSNDVSTLGPSAFSGCEKLENFECYGNLTYVPNSTFERCKNLVSVILPNSVTKIGNRTFYGCEKLPKLDLPECLASIGTDALKGCRAIKKIYIPTKLDKIGIGAFSYMSSLNRIEVSPKNKNYTSYDNLSLIDCSHESLIQYAIGSENKQYSIEPFSWYIDGFAREIIRQTTSINQYAFAGASHLEELTLLTSVEYLEKTAFQNCPKLKTLYVKRLPLFSVQGFRVTENKEYDWEGGDFPFENVYLDDTIISLEISAFSGFKRLKNLHLPNEQLETIKQQAFNKSNELREVFIPACVKTILLDTFANSTMLKFANGTEVIGSNFHDLQSRNKSKIYTLNNGVYYVEKNGCVVSISKRKLKELCSNSELIINSPELVLDYMELMTIHGKNNKDLMNGILISALKYEEAESLIKNYDEKSEAIIHASRILIDPTSSISQSIIKTPKKLVNYIDVIKASEVKDINLMNSIFISALNEKDAELFIKTYDANVKRIIVESEVLSNPDTAIDNMKDLVKLAKVLGVFESNPIIKQRACCFIAEKIFAHNLTQTKENDYRIIGDDIHRKFNEMVPREAFDSEFANFFINNYRNLCDYEATHSGFMGRVYNRFQEISKTSTSDKGEQKHLLVTFDKCRNYLLTHKFNGITPETEQLALLLGEWFDNDDAFQSGVAILNEAKPAPRNIFSKFTVAENEQVVFDNNAKNDLREPRNKNYSFEWLVKQDISNLVLGKFCNCCAHINGAGAGIMRASMISPDCQNLVVRNNFNEIVSKSTLYVNRKGNYAVFNNMESSSLYISTECKEKIYKAFMRGTTAFLEKFNENNPHARLNLITIGTSRNTIKDILEEKSEIHPENPVLEAIKYGEYSLNGYGLYNGDSSTQQRIVLRKQ